MFTKSRKQFDRTFYMTLAVAKERTKAYHLRKRGGGFKGERSGSGKAERSGEHNAEWEYNGVMY